MKRIIERLKTKFSQPGTAIVLDQPSDSASVGNDNLEQDDYVIETSLGADAPNRIVSQGKDVLMPDIYADRQVDIQPNNKALDQPTADIEEPDGFNDYDSAVLQKKQR